MIQERTFSILYCRLLAVPFWIVERARKIAELKSWKVEWTTGGAWGRGEKKTGLGLNLSFPLPLCLCSFISPRSSLAALCVFGSRALSTIQKGTASSLSYIATIWHIIRFVAASCFASLSYFVFSVAFFNYHFSNNFFPGYRGDNFNIPTVDMEKKKAFWTEYFRFSFIKLSSRW